VLKPTGITEIFEFAPGLEIIHQPDHEKSRASYLPLLELAVKEDPDDDRNVFYLARELMYAGRWVESRAMFQRHLTMGVWAPERAWAMRCMASMCFEGSVEQERWYLKACAEAPTYREPWLELAQYYLSTDRRDLARTVARRALEIKERQLEYLTDSKAWNGTLERIAGDTL
jgi:tetratricopeptide (TPR) repeat protein